MFRDSKWKFLYFQHKRAAEAIRGPYNANRHSRYVELVLVIDKKEYIALDENLDKVHQHCKDIANIINAVSMQFYQTSVRIVRKGCPKNFIYMRYDFLIQFQEDLSSQTRFLG